MTDGLGYFYFIGPKMLLMGEGFILLTRGYGFMGGGDVPPPFDMLKKNVLLVMI